MSSNPERVVLARRLESMVQLGFWLLGLLLIQNVIGMALNLYLTLPTGPTFAEVFLSIPVLTLHILVAFLVVGLAAVALVFLRRLKLPRLLGWASLTLVGVVVALQEGFAYTFTQETAYSYGMEIGFLTAVGAQVLVLYHLSAARASLHAGSPVANVLSDATRSA